MYSLKQVAAPVNLPVTLEETKLYLHEDGDLQDDVITSLIKAAVAHAERITGRALMPQTFDFGFAAFPRNGIIRVPGAPLQAVSEISYLDAQGATQVIASTDYVVDKRSEPGCIYPAHGKYWPYTFGFPGSLYQSVYWPSYGARSRYGLPRPDSIIVRFACGYAEAASPEDADAERAAVHEDIKLAVKMLVAHWYESRVAVEVGLRAQAIDIPLTAVALLDPHRLFGIYP